MFAFFKAVILGAIFSFVISMVVGHAGGTGGAASVHPTSSKGSSFTGPGCCSWPARRWLSPSC